MRVVFINGIWTDPGLEWNTMRHAFAKAIPAASFVTETEPYCHPWQIQRLRRFIDDLVEKYDDGIDTIFVGHSMGGLIACAVQPRLVKTNVIGIATVHAPHSFLFGIFTRLLGAQFVSAPLLTFQGMFDVLVLWGTAHADSRRHIVQCSNHFTNLATRQEIADNIAEKCVETFFVGRAAA